MEPGEISYIAIAARALHVRGLVSSDSIGRWSCQVRWEEIRSGESVGLYVSITLDHWYLARPGSHRPPLPKLISYRFGDTGPWQEELDVWIDGHYNEV